MRFQNLFGLTMVLGFGLFIGGCGKSTKTEAKPAKSGAGVVEEHKGPHGGMLFDLGPGHKIMGEFVVSKDPHKLELYIVDHHDTTKAIMSGSKTVTITSIKADGKPVSDITLAMDPLKTDKEGCSHFILTGDKLPKEIGEDHDLIGAKITVLLGGKSVETTVVDHGH